MPAMTEHATDGKTMTTTTTAVIDLDLPGARSIIRPAERDLFRLGADEAYNEGYRDGFDESQAEGDERRSGYEE